MPNQRVLRGCATCAKWYMIVGIVLIACVLLFDGPMVPRTKSYRAFCMNNLKQLGMASMMYLDDHDWHYWTSSQPYTAALVHHLRTPNVFTCKSDKRKTSPSDIDPTTGHVVGGRQAMRVSYLCNSRLRKAGTITEQNAAMLSRLVVLVDDSSGDGSKRACFGNPNSAAAYHKASQVGRHYDRDNYLFADGHVKAVPGGDKCSTPEGATSYDKVRWDPSVRPAGK